MSEAQNWDRLPYWKADSMVKAVKMLRASIGCGEILFEGHS